MRTIQYLSPTSLSLWESDRTEFYLRYCADNRPPRVPQTRPMAIGSAFDAFVKNYLVGALYSTVPPEFAISAIFEAQVEPQNRDWALEHGEALFNEYRRLGALSDLMIEMSHATSTPRFEFTVENRVAHTAHAAGIPLLGKPDCHFTLASGSELIIDWKVNGYCSASPVSPKAGYMKERPSGRAHRDCQQLSVAGIPINMARPLDTVDVGWATQLCIYGWVISGAIAPLFGIEQLCCRGLESCGGLRVASHRCKISPEFRLSLLDRLAQCWGSIQSGHIFTELTLGDSVARCSVLDNYYKAYEVQEGANIEHEEWFKTITR